MKVYEKVSAYLAAEGIDTVALSDRIGVPHDRLVAWLNGDETMYAENLKVICLALNVSPELFIEVQPPSGEDQT